MQESAIIKACLSGDRSAQAKLYHLYASKMMGLCMWYAKNREEAEEILQDGFLRVFNFLDRYSGKGSFEGWMRKIMVNAALAKYRSRPQKLWAVTELMQASDIGEPEMFSYIYDEKILMGLVQALPPAYRIVFNLFVFEGFKHREIAEALDISEGTSKSNLSDARRLLQAGLTAKKKSA